MEQVMVGCLKEIERKYDRSFILHGPASVGSDCWTVASD